MGCNLMCNCSANIHLQAIDGADGFQNTHQMQQFESAKFSIDQVKFVYQRSLLDSSFVYVFFFFLFLILTASTFGIGGWLGGFHSRESSYHMGTNYGPFNLLQKHGYRLRVGIFKNR